MIPNQTGQSASPPPDFLQKPSAGEYHRRFLLPAEVALPRTPFGDKTSIPPTLPG